MLLCGHRGLGQPQRSSTGTKGKAISKTRTSDNAFVTHTKTAQALKRRIFKLLGIEEYHESWADGLQVRAGCRLGRARMLFVLLVVLAS